MSSESLTIPAQRGTSIPAHLARGDGQWLAVLFPGLTYRNTMPVMHFSRLLLAERGADVLAVDYAYDLNSDFRGASDEDQLEWIGADGRAVLSAALDLGSYRRCTIVGKSLGTIAMGWSVPDEPRLAQADLVWLTPSLQGTGLRERMSRCGGRSVVVIGTRDPGFESTLVNEWKQAGTATIVVAGADHGLERPGDVLGSLAALEEVFRPLGAWLDEGRP
jgi:hypothetical protein